MLALSARPAAVSRSGQRQTVRRGCRISAAASSASEPVRVVITGGSKGLGLALASEFLKNGDSVVLSSRAADRVNEAVSQLRSQHSSERVYGLPGDVSRASDVDALTSFALEKMGGVDVWINNAASNGYKYAPLVDTDPELLEEIVRTNALGTLLCCRAAARVMQKQPRGGHIFNMEGGGSEGEATKLFSAYGFTKAGIPQLNKSLQQEIQDTGVRVHSISPGMVFTELVSSGSNAFGSQGRFFVNAVAQAPEDVAAEVVPKVREIALAPAAPGAQQGQTIRVFTPQIAATRLLRRLVFGENKDKYFPEDEKEYARTMSGR